VDSHFGKITVESTEGEGTVFINAFQMNNRPKKEELKKENETS
jgi:light-regulated signal transduction histidine kinase (bacteriophytochrome)